MTRHSDILVIGAGPAGLAAATAAAESFGQTGRVVTVLDDSLAAGGQIWRSGVVSDSGKKDAAKDRTMTAFHDSGAVLLSGRRVVDAPRKGVLQVLAEPTGTIERHSWDRLILATGARERFLPFPGWTLPGVFGAGGLQALVKGGYSVAGKRIVIAGTGPLLLAVAVHLQQYGAEIVALAEQATAGAMMRFAAKLWSYPAKLLQGAGYRAALAGTRYRTGCWPVAAEGTERVTGVRLTDGRRTWTEPCDLLGCGFHLVPNTELASLLGCALDGEYVSVNQQQETSLEDVFCAGEPTGIAGLEAAIVQGKIAGLCAAGEFANAAGLFRRRDRERRFGKELSHAFALRSELLGLASDDTVVCRCEDVRFGQLRQQTSWTEAKLQTRCGMGPCQGRVCGPAVETIFGWKNASIRPPLFPVPVSALCANEAADGNDEVKETLEVL